MSNVKDFPTDQRAAIVCLQGAIEECESINASWAIVILPDGDAVTCVCSHTFSHPRFCGHLEEAKAVSLLAEIEAGLSE
jgi:hypothetical protein